VKITEKKKHAEKSDRLQARDHKELVQALPQGGEWCELRSLLLDGLFHGKSYY
jgi:hypothetical protein